MFLIWKIIKIPKINKFWNCSSIRYAALFAISFSIVLTPRKFGRSTFARSLIFKFEISAILKFYRSKFWPSPVTSFLQRVVFFSQSNLKMTKVNKKPRLQSVSLNKKMKALKDITTNGIHASQIATNLRGTSVNDWYMIR